MYDGGWRNQRFVVIVRIVSGDSCYGCSELGNRCSRGPVLLAGVNVLARTVILVVGIGSCFRHGIEVLIDRFPGIV